MSGSSPLESYVVSKLHLAETELERAHQVLDMKQVPRAVEGHPNLSLAQRILAMNGELDEIFARQRQAEQEASIDSLTPE